MRYAGLALLTCLLLGAAAWSVDWQFWSRYMARPQSPAELSVEWYQPQAKVAGDYEPLPRGPAQVAAHFAEAMALAEDYGSQALLVAVGDTVVLERYWGQTGPDTPLLSFSFHKTVTALLVGAAIADGHIAGVDAPVGNYIPQWADEPRGRPSLRSVMQMSAGYAQPSREGGAFSEAARFSFGSDITAATLKGGLVEAGDARFDYSERSAQIAGLALQNALPTDYPSYLSERLWQELRARDSAVVTADEDGSAITYCCLMATAEDWLKIGMLIRDKGRFDGRQIIRADWIEEMIKPTPTNPNFGLFVWLGTPFNPARTYTSASPASVRSEVPFAVDDIVFMDGAGGQRVYVSRQLDLVVVRLGEYRADWDDTRLFNAVATRIPELSNSLDR